MNRLSQIAAPAVLGIALVSGMAGCAGRDHYRDVPGQATMIAEGRGNVTTTFGHPGTAYVFDDSTHRLLYSGDVRPGDRLNVDARHDEIWLNGQVVAHPRMDDSDHYKILMDQHPLAQGAYYNQPPTVIQKETTVTETPGPSDNTVTEKKTTIEEKPAVIQEKTTVEKQVQPR